MSNARLPSRQSRPAWTEAPTNHQRPQRPVDRDPHQQSTPLFSLRCDSVLTMPVASKDRRLMISPSGKGEKPRVTFS